MTQLKAQHLAKAYKGRKVVKDVSLAVKQRKAQVSFGYAVIAPGVNDSTTLFPALLLEAHGWDPSTFLPGSA